VYGHRRRSRRRRRHAKAPTSQSFVEAIVSHSRKLFWKFLHKIFATILRNIIGLEIFLLYFSQLMNR